MNIKGNLIYVKQFNFYKPSMKQFSIVNILLLFLSNSVFAQTYLIQTKHSGEKLWGYDNQKGEIIIPAKYEKCYEFSEDGLAPVFDESKKKFVFINSKGEAIPVAVDKFEINEGFFGAGMMNFNNGLIPVKIDKKWGYVNKEGKLAIPAKYDGITEFNGGYAAVKSGDKSFIIDTKGTETPVSINDIDLVQHFSEGLAPYKTKNGSFGFTDAKGKSVINAQFKSVGYFTGGLAWAKTSDDKVGYINGTGAWVIQPSFDTGKDFDPESGYARVKTFGKEGVWQYIDKSGKVLTVDSDGLFGDFNNGLAKGKKGELVGFFNTKGEWIIKPQFEAVRDFKNGFAAAKSGGKWGLIDKTGKWTINPTLEGIKDVAIIK